MCALFSRIAGNYFLTCLGCKGVSVASLAKALGINNFVFMNDGHTHSVDAQGDTSLLNVVGPFWKCVSSVGHLRREQLAVVIS